MSTTVHVVAWLITVAVSMYLGAWFNANRPRPRRHRPRPRSQRPAQTPRPETPVRPEPAYASYEEPPTLVPVAPPVAPIHDAETGEPVPPYDEFEPAPAPITATAVLPPSGPPISGDIGVDVDNLYRDAPVRPGHERPPHGKRARKRWLAQREADTFVSELDLDTQPGQDLSYERPPGPDDFDARSEIRSGTLSTPRTPSRTIGKLTSVEDVEAWGARMREELHAWAVELTESPLALPAASAPELVGTR
jgi:hypothetical protein